MEFNFQDLITNLSDGLYIVDKKRKILFWNKAAEKITGYSAKDVIGTHCYNNILIHVDDYGNNLCHGICPLAATINDSKQRSANVYLHHKEGHRIPIQIKTVCLRNHMGKVIGGAELFTDISDQVLKDTKIKELEELAFLDPLTKLANRNFINLELENKISEMERYKINFGILFLDIDSFKSFNDKYGHNIGDLILKTVSNTIKANIRPFDLAGRWGGEEFICIIHNITESIFSAFAERLRVLIEKSIVNINNELLNVTVSIGGALIKEKEDASSLIERADMAMYKSKAKGKNIFTLSEA